MSLKSNSNVNRLRRAGGLARRLASGWGAGDPGLRSSSLLALSVAVLLLGGTLGCAAGARSSGSDGGDTELGSVRDTGEQAANAEPIVPYLQPGGARGDDVVVHWFAPRQAGSRVEYRLASEQSGRLVAGSSGPFGSATLSDLLPDTTYTYQVVAGGDSSAIFTFRTFPTRAADGTSRPFHFIAYGDNRSHPDRHAEVVASILAGPPPLLTLSTGDLVRSGEDSVRWHRELLTPGAPLFGHSPLLLVLGNHDLDQRTRPRPLATWWRELFSFPGEKTTSGYGRWYSVDVGGIHFVCLDSNSPDDPEQIAWLAADLTSPAAAAADFIIASFHHPPFSAGGHHSDRRVRAAWVPLLERHGVDLVFNGHNHFYQRTHLLRDGRPLQPPAAAALSPVVFPAGRGTVYCVTGGGGAPLYNPDNADFVAVSARDYHHVRVHYAPGQLACTAVGIAGEIIDEFSIVKY